MPGLQGVDAATGVPLARRANDRLAETVARHPDRFAAFAALPTADPRAAADELERTVTQARLQGRDDQRPDWRHCSTTTGASGRSTSGRRPWTCRSTSTRPCRGPAVIEAYYKDYAQQHPGLLRAAWGFTVETATQGVRFVLSGVFDAYPGLKMILGHMGEGLPFMLWRISYGLRASMSEKTFRDVFCEHFWITTSGFFSDPALLCCVMEMGIDRVLFSVDYPFAENPPGTEWTKTLPLGPEDTEKLLNGNARRLLKL